MASDGRYPKIKASIKSSTGPEKAAAQGDTFARVTSSQPAHAGATRYAPAVNNITPSESEKTCTKTVSTNKITSGPSKITA
jgi:hypothetical protein